MTAPVSPDPERPQLMTHLLSNRRPITLIDTPQQVSPVISLRHQQSANLPWHIVQSHDEDICAINDCKGHTVTVCRDADAKLIIAAVNAYLKLVSDNSGLTLALYLIQQLLRKQERSTPYVVEALRLIEDAFQVDGSV